MDYSSLSVLADELHAVARALGEIEHFEVAVPDLRMDTYLARRICREAAEAILQLAEKE